MNVYEMEGFLRGKCLPGDLKVNESNAEYLVRKLNVASGLKGELTAALATIKKCREIVGCPEGVDLQDHLRQLAAENVTARNAVQVFCDVVGANTDAICEEVGPEGVRAILAAMSATGNMPATDRIYAGIKADGVSEFIASLPSYGDTEVDTYADGVKAAIETTQTVYGPVFIKLLREGAK
ncbi:MULTISPECIES: ead/Ea22-like family protein [unclassified Raoultella]|uniref:ead/Ea22-like family protein n=1 Tax=unclassified Raoultella TaxID=2627600 RepID=UPI001357D3E0|nr:MULTISPECIES: ead/Ea22-like family protein [unclassified Raoultella]